MEQNNSKNSNELNVLKIESTPCITAIEGQPYYVCLVCLLGLLTTSFEIMNLPPTWYAQAFVHGTTRKSENTNEFGISKDLHLFHTVNNGDRMSF